MIYTAVISALAVALAIETAWIIMRSIARSNAVKFREERISVYAQLAELFVEWGGLNTCATREYDPYKRAGTRYSVVVDKFGVREPKLEVIAGSDELRQRMSVAESMRLERDGRVPGDDDHKIDDLYRYQALVHCPHGVIGPIPLAWANMILMIESDGKLRPPRVEVLVHGPASEDGRQG